MGYRSDDDSTANIVLFVVAILVALFLMPILGSCVSTEAAQKVATTQLSPQAQIEGKDVWFVSFKGCDKGDAAVFKVEPYTNSNGQMVDNAIICGGWPFKGMTVRYK